MKRFADLWNAFWFTPAPTTTLAALRVGVGLLALVSGLILLPDVDVFYAPTRIGTTAATLIDGALLVAAVCLVVGFRTRLASIAVVCCLIVLCNANPIIFNGGDALLRHLAVVMALAPVGAGLSLDRRLQGRDGWACPPRAVWPLRLVQIQVVVMYLAAVASKLAGTTWRDGTAASYPLRIDAVSRLPLFADVAGSPFVASLLTWGTLAVEAAIPLLVWNRRARPWVLAFGVCLHLTIDVTLRAGLFSWVVFVAYLSFVPPASMGAAFALFGLPHHRASELGTEQTTGSWLRPALRGLARRQPTHP